MKKERPAQKKNGRKICLLPVCVLLLIALIGVMSSLLTRPGAERSLEEYRALFPKAEIALLSDGSVELRPGPGTEKKSAGFVFYVGAQIMPEAYIPLLARLTEAGYFCSIPKLPSKWRTSSRTRRRRS